MSVNFKPLPAQPAPVENQGFGAWIKTNLFSSVFNSIISVIILGLLLLTLPRILDWLIFSANFGGTTEADCTNDGACWVFIKAWSQQLFYGSYPETELWRIHLCLGVLALVILSSFVLPQKYRNKVSIPFFLVFPFFAITILDGRLFELPYIHTDLWGGFTTLNIILAASSIIIAFPLGFLWALGRRSEMPFLFFPEGVTVDKLLRVWIILILFMSAYMAEVFRSGFQAIPKGQYEAADSLGLSYWKKTMLILFPQVVKISMPNILATFVMVFKNTVFLLVIAVPEMLQIVQGALSNSNWLGGHATEGYVFVGIVFWVCCYGMSLLANNIESKLDTDKRD